MHAEYPAPTFTLWTGMVALELIFKALAQGMPGGLPASSGGEVPGYMVVGIHPDSGRLYAVSNGESVGWGAAPDHDGADVLNHLCQTVVRNTPMEVMETKTAVLFERAEVLIDSGGAGRFRGGVGFRRELRFVADGELITVSKKTTSPPWALEGAGESSPNAMIVHPDTPRAARLGTRRSPSGPASASASSPRAAAVAAIRAVATGRGAREDVLDGFVSPAAAHRLYGLTETTPTEPIYPIEPTPGGPSS